MTACITQNQRLNTKSETKRQPEQNTTDYNKTERTKQNKKKQD